MKYNVYSIYCKSQSSEKGKLLSEKIREKFERTIFDKDMLTFVLKWIETYVNGLNSRFRRKAPWTVSLRFSDIHGEDSTGWIQIGPTGKDHIMMITLVQVEEINREDLACF